MRDPIAYLRGLLVRWRFRLETRLWFWIEIRDLMSRYDMDRIEALAISRRLWEGILEDLRRDMERKGDLEELEIFVEELQDAGRRVS